MSLFALLLIPLMGLHVFRTLRRLATDHKLDRPFAAIGDVFGAWTCIWIVCLGVTACYQMNWGNGELNWLAAYFFIATVVSAIGAGIMVILE